jgi:phospholipid/cholesterol/gamma-HCH transport system ATP-binding protein
MIEVKDVSISFKDLQVLDGISLSVQTGESFVLVGPSGQGKSVLLKLLGGILTPTKGEVLIDGQNLNAIAAKDRNALLKRMGMLFQKNALFDSLTVGENIAFPLAELTDLSRPQREEKVDYFLKEVGLSDAKGLFPDEMSGGMQKRLGIARALALDPEIIFYDDPTAGLDPITSRMIIQLILRLQEERSSTVIAITNDMNRAYQLADRIGVIVDQKLIVTGTEEETKKHTDPRVHQFIRGLLDGPLTVQP